MRFETNREREKGRYEKNWGCECGGLVWLEEKSTHYQSQEIEELITLVMECEDCGEVSHPVLLHKDPPDYW